MPSDGTRRTGRIPKQIAITLIGSDIEGRIFSERTKTVVLSRHGAGIISSYKLSPEQELVIRSEGSPKEVEGRVVGQIGSDGDTYIYGVAFLDQGLNFWGIDFPELSETEQRARQTLLECSSCQARETADHSDLASDVMAINESIVRYCQKCGSSTLWKQPVAGGVTVATSSTKDARLPKTSLAEQTSARGVAPSGEEARKLPARAEPLVAPAPWRDGKRPSPAAERPAAFAGAAWMEAEMPNPAEAFAPSNTQPPTSDASEFSPADHNDRKLTVESSGSKAPGSGTRLKEQENRRKHVRTRVNLKACIRRAGFPDDVVLCEDMSRGGLRFKSTRKYLEKMSIQVAVPYSPGDQAIFMPAEIAYVEELPGKKKFRCGVKYLRVGKQK
jgi:hypothetical protein